VQVSLGHVTCKQWCETTKVAFKHHLNQYFSSLFVNTYRNTFNSSSNKPAKANIIYTAQCRHHKAPRIPSKGPVSTHLQIQYSMVVSLTTIRRLHRHQDRPQRHLSSHRPHQTGSLWQSRFHQWCKQRHRSLHRSQFCQSRCIYRGARSTLRSRRQRRSCQESSPRCWKITSTGPEDRAGRYESSFGRSGCS
jgi:hypothetical protein